jgi:predicted translin family RNA/ssDNA-binding protein
VAGQTLSLTDEIYAELVDGLKTGLDWTQFLAKHGASKGPLYNAIGRFFNDLEPKVRALNEVQAKLDADGLTLDQLDRQIKEAEGKIAPLENKKNSLSERVETLETRVAEKSELIKQVGALEKFGFDEERLRQLHDALGEIGAKHGLKGKEATSKFFDDLKDYEAIVGAELRLKGLQTQIETRSLELDMAEKKLEKARDEMADVQKALASYQRLVSMGFDEKALGELEEAGKKYGTPRTVLTAVSRFAGLSDIKTATEDMKGKLKQEKADVEATEKKHLHLKSIIEMCEDLLRRKFSLQTITLIRETAMKYGEAVDVMKAIEAHGSLKEIEKKISQARTGLVETQAKIQRQKELEAEYQARIRATLEQLEALNAKAIDVGRQAGVVLQQIKKDTLARDVLNLVQNPTSAGYENCLPLVIVLLKSIIMWANMNKSKFSYHSLLDKNLEEAVRHLGGS